MRAPSVWSTLLAAALVAGCGTSTNKDLPAKAEKLEGFDVGLDVRSSTYAGDEIGFDALATNGADKTLIGLTVALSVRGSDGKELERIEISPVGSRSQLTILEPGFSAPIHLKRKVAGTPASVVASVTKAELFPEQAEAPRTLDVRAAGGADVSGLEFVSLGHYRIDSVGEAGSAPFRATLGVRNKGKETIGRLDYGIVFTDDQGRDVDRIPIIQVFEPPLKPGDAVPEPVVGSARRYDKMLIEVRSATKP